MWKIYCCAPHLARVVQSIRDLSRVTGICKSFQVQKMTIQSTIRLLFSSLSSFHLPGFFSSQLLIFFPCMSRLISLFSWCHWVILHFSPIRLLARCKPENLAKCCRRGVSWRKRCGRRQPHAEAILTAIRRSRTGRSQAPSFLLILTSERKLLSSFMSSQKEATSHQAWSSSLEKSNSPLAESTASGRRASTSTYFTRSMPWKHRGFHLGIACSKLEDKLNLCTRLCVFALLGCQKAQTDFDSEKHFFFRRDNWDDQGKQLNIWARLSVSEKSDTSFWSRHGEPPFAGGRVKQCIPPPPEASMWNSSHESCSRNPSSLAVIIRRAWMSSSSAAIWSRRKWIHYFESRNRRLYFLVVSCFWWQ